MASDAKADSLKPVLVNRGAVAWHTLAVTAVTSRLGVEFTTGLALDEATRRATYFGANAIREQPARSPVRMLLNQFADFMIVVLISAAVVSGVIGDIEDTLAIVVIVLLNAVIGFVQEFRAERAMAALKALAASHAQVRRGGQRMNLSATELVPGDIVLLEAGNVVPADLRVIEAAQLKLDEALLTGESATVEKRVEPIDQPAMSLGDRINMVYKGTIVSYGRGCGVVVATGMDTELGKIAALLDTGTELKTPLQQRLAQFGKRLAIAVLAICAIIFGVGLLRGEPLLLMFLTAVSLAVAAIPEALPAIVTISLALGARKMVTQHALIRRLPAVETLGSVTYICSDKTGTLTHNKMKVAEAYADGARVRDLPTEHKGEPWQTLLRALALSNDASRGQHGRVMGDPTEVALFLAAAAAGYDKASLEVRAPRVMELPFDSERKRMTTLHQGEDGLVAFTKGSPESVLPRCCRVLTSTGEQPLDNQAILKTADGMAAEGLRVLAVAYRAWAASAPPPVPTDSPEQVERELVFLGLVGLQDPPRREAEEAVRLCKSAGITPVMITGDHPVTARAIGAKLGILDAGGMVMTGPELASIDDAMLKQRVSQIRVYARVDPQQKIRIVRALQQRGEFVAMTGDGVNDAPALQRADIGVAMGKGGTDVAREASSLVLLDDNFATIVGAVREGRRIFDNIRKFIRYTMTSNSAEIWTIFLAPFLGLPIPLLPIHILWINLVTDGLPGLALAVEPAERGIMRRPPRPPRESIFAGGMWQHMLWAGLTMAAVTLLTQAYAIHIASAHWQTMVFTVLTLSQMGHALAIRSERDSLFRQGLFSNIALLGAIALTFVLQLATIYLPALNPVFKTAPLTAQELVFCLAMSSVVFFAVEIEKLLVRTGVLYGRNG